MEKFKFWSVLIAVSSISLLIGSFIAKADGDSSQSFTMQSRYALLSGPILVRSENYENPTTANAIFKIDSVTGQVWVLYLTIESPARPIILSARFVPTDDISSN